jgi:hypothetical protein
MVKLLTNAKLENKETYLQSNIPFNISRAFARKNYLEL